MKEFFKVTNLGDVLGLAGDFSPVGTEEIDLMETGGRVLAENVISDIDLPDFSRSTMDGYAVSAVSTFGASEGNPAYLNIKGTIMMGESSGFSIGSGEAAKISTGGMLPDGADSVVMVEYTEAVDDTTIEVYRSVAPGQHVIGKGEDLKEGEAILSAGVKIRPQETGILAALGKEKIKVYQQPSVGILSTGDEIVPINMVPKPGQIRDINTYTLSGLVEKAGGIPKIYGIVIDDYDVLFDKCSRALQESDMVVISGGSSVGTRDFTIEVLSNLPDSEIFIHGISISPGKPTILAGVQGKPFWGLPGHVVSAMVVFEIVVKPFIEQLGGIPGEKENLHGISAVLTRNISSAPGRGDFVRVRLIEENGNLMAEPVLGKSGLINTMVKADGLVKVGTNTEGLDKGTVVEVMLI